MLLIALKLEGVLQRPRLALEGIGLILHLKKLHSFFEFASVLAHVEESIPSLRIMAASKGILFYF